MQGTKYGLTVQARVPITFSNTAVGDQLQHGEQQGVFTWQQALGQCFRRVACDDGYLHLGNHRACVQFRHDQVHAGPVFAITCFQCARMSA